MLLKGKDYEIRSLTHVMEHIFTAEIGQITGHLAKMLLKDK